MTIDNAISFCDEKSNNIKLKAEPQTFIDIKEMLEEYKVFKEGNYAQKYGKCPMCMDCPKNCPLDK